MLTNFTNEGNTFHRFRRTLWVCPKDGTNIQELTFDGSYAEHGDVIDTTFWCFRCDTTWNATWTYEFGDGGGLVPDFVTDGDDGILSEYRGVFDVASRAAIEEVRRREAAMLRRYQAWLRHGGPRQGMTFRHVDNEVPLQQTGLPMFLARLRRMLHSRGSAIGFPPPVYRKPGSRR
jgi:hypothetical protein